MQLEKQSFISKASARVRRFSTLIKLLKERHVCLYVLSTMAKWLNGCVGFISFMLQKPRHCRLKKSQFLGSSLSTSPCVSA